MSQADDYAQAIDIALEAASKRHERPELNAMLGALARRTGNGLSLIGDERLRGQLYKKVCAEIERAMNEPNDQECVLVPVSN